MLLKKKNVLTSNSEFESLIISLYSRICYMYIEYIVSFNLLREIYFFLSNNKIIVGSIIFFNNKITFNPFVMGDSKVSFK